MTTPITPCSCRHIHLNVRPPKRRFDNSELGPSSDHLLSPSTLWFPHLLFFSSSSEDDLGLGRSSRVGGTFETFLQRRGLRVRAEGGSRRKTGSVDRMNSRGYGGYRCRRRRGVSSHGPGRKSGSEKKGVGVVPTSFSFFAVLWC
jgi:hypothetical protein